MIGTPEVVKAYPECPWCGSTETGTELAVKHLKLREKGLVKDGMHVSASKIMVPLYNPQIAVLAIPFMIQEVDCCGECGRNRIIKITVAEIPYTLAKGMMGQGTGN